MCGQPDYTPADLIEVDIDGDRVFIHMADYFARPLRFTSAELSGLYLACEAVRKLSGPPASSALTSAMDKIAGVLEEGSVPREVVQDSVEFRPPTPWLEIVAELSRACEQRRVVEMEYYTYGRDEITRRLVHPLSLEFGMGNWYLRAWDRRNKEIRVFRVDRIKDMEVTAGEFEPPPEEEAEGASPGVYGVAGGEIEVRLRFSPALARRAAEKPIFSRTEMVKGRLVCTVHTDNLSWLEREILGFGPGVEVLSPPELKERLRARLLSMLSFYG
jgi:proteasome accessory factor C